MNLSNIAFEAIEIFKLVLPFMFIGFLIANMIKLSPYLDYIGKPMSNLTSISHLPGKCSVALTMFFVNHWSGLAILSDFNRKRILGNKEVIIAVLIGELPKGLYTAIFLLGPVALSVLGFFVGGILITLELLIHLWIAMIGVVAGRLLLNPQPAPDLTSTTGNSSVFNSDSKKWMDKLKIVLKESLKEFKRILVVLIPTVLVLLTLLDLGLQESLAEVFKSLLSIVDLPPSSVMVLTASIASEMAAISACGALIVKNLITPSQCLLLLFIARALHLGIGCFRIGLPTNVALFGNLLGLKVTLAVYSLIELGIAILIILLIWLI